MDKQVENRPYYYTHWTVCVCVSPGATLVTTTAEARP